MLLICEYASPVWSRPSHASKIDPVLNAACRAMRPTRVDYLCLLCGISPTYQTGSLIPAWETQTRKRPSASSLWALVEMFHSWCEATDKPDSFVRVLLVDYSKAFDHINHELLITKICDMGLSAHLVRWMAAFLIDRQQSVKIGDPVSNIGYPNGGVPQGTFSGPTNFLVQINDLQTPCPTFKYIDDSTVFDVCNNTSVPMLQESVDVITDWSRRNDMRINARKTKEMIICFCRNDNHVASISRIVLDDNDIERVTQAKVVVVTLSSDLSWNAHVDTIVSKARKRVFFLLFTNWSALVSDNAICLERTWV